MLTRLEVSGFKNLLDLEVEFGPFTCIAGPNGVGKSNLFDAIRFLSLLAEFPFAEAARRVRGDDGSPTDPRTLFWTDGHSHAASMRFAAEMLVPHQVFDDFGREVKPTTTFLRYELELGYEVSAGLAPVGRLVLLTEKLTHITKGRSGEHLRFPHSARHFRDKVVEGHRAGQAFISTRVAEDGRREVLTHQDGGSRGNPKPSPADRAPATIVQTTTSAWDPTILAARREMLSWRQLALEPSAMRKSDRFDAPPKVSESGAHLAATLYRLAVVAPAERVLRAERVLKEAGTPEQVARAAVDLQDARDVDSEAVYAGIAARLSALLSVQGLSVERDDRQQLLTLMLQLVGGAVLPARSHSDGTLRFLALCLIGADPTFTGVICMEEPENGIHPTRLEAMASLLRSMAVHPQEEPGLDNPLRQIIVNTHSPEFVRLQEDGDLLFAYDSLRQWPAALERQPPTETRPVRCLVLRPIHGTWRTRPGQPAVGSGEILPYLEAGRGQLSLAKMA